MAVKIDEPKLIMHQANNPANAIVSDPQRFGDFCRHIANGGSIREICRLMKVRYGDLYAAISADTELSKVYHKALEARRHYDVEEILAQLRSMATSDIRDLFKPDGSLKHPTEMTFEQSASIQSFEVETVTDGQGNDTGNRIKKVKMWDKLKAIDLIGKSLGMFAERHIHEGTVTLRDLVLKSVNDEKETEEAAKTRLLISDKT